MPNLPISQILTFDTELSLASSSLTGSPVLIGTITNEPVILMIKNQTSQAVFISDTNSSTKGTTMAVGEEIVLDCRANNGKADNMGFPINTSFYATGTSGTGSIKISILYAK